MAEEPRSRPVQLDPSSLLWDTPAAALQRLDALAHLADIDRLAEPPPLPVDDRLRILGSLLDHLLPDGTTEWLPETAALLDPAQRKHLARLVLEARAALRQRQAIAPATLLGFAPDTRARWANLLDQGWIPMQPGWVARHRTD
ncbi:hypothetical protein [Roseinatronobacter sp.]|uniref:hypothetical protein n=1 Tax=Roseinatronobacter sp. TaxID=1945755 RepID=UPI0025E8E8DC|nr:hypothetical protein [Roseibaca sp.]